MSKGKRDRTAQARAVVAKQQAAERRRKVTLWTSVGVVMVLFLAGLVGYTVMSRQDDGKVTTPTAAVDDGTAFAIGTGSVVVDVYEDFMCPACGNFEQASGESLQNMAEANKITLRIHPVAILDKYSNGTEYSTRAAGAAAAAAEEDKFLELHNVLYDNRPEENSDGLSNEKIIELAKSVGLTSETFVNAVNEGTYKTWATDVTEKFSDRGYNSTPTILVDGTKLIGPNDTVPTSELLTQTIEKAAG
ncbi:protein-disulfide isomerase [Actinoplanes lutulentus]|uniref:Protein-disulfide isomerase n=1 Tax=Actinoplanes lutulentus TaxID=1287878 RepID=A0A327ZIA4_9ACTN|nr:thioredoxin domain-containing protein [Actinoplanes lutulentus]MBB2947960.1 protein-disulfide isomerase [Actinoplanes lutulentus]RAK40159.1 protein-disulfide isomerase [Actinoplanes lutulentus]